jgi:hypothetical protein
MAESPQNQIPTTPEIPIAVVNPESGSKFPEISVEKPAVVSQPSIPQVEDTLAADQAAAVTLEETMSIEKPEDIRVTGDTSTGKSIESWFTELNNRK